MTWNFKSFLVCLSLILSQAAGLSAFASNIVNLKSSSATVPVKQPQLPVKDLSYCSPLRESIDQTLTKITKNNATFANTLIANYQTMLELWKNTDCTQLGTQPEELNAQQKKTEICSQLQNDYSVTMNAMTTVFQQCYAQTYLYYEPLCKGLNETIKNCAAMGCSGCQSNSYLTDCSISGYNHIIDSQNLSCQQVQCNL